MFVLTGKPSSFFSKHTTNEKGAISAVMMSMRSRECQELLIEVGVAIWHQMQQCHPWVA